MVTGLKEDASINRQIVVMRVRKRYRKFHVKCSYYGTYRVMKQVAAVKNWCELFRHMTEYRIEKFYLFCTN